MSLPFIEFTHESEELFVVPLEDLRAVCSKGAGLVEITIRTGPIVSEQLVLAEYEDVIRTMKEAGATIWLAS